MARSFRIAARSSVAAMPGPGVQAHGFMAEPKARNFLRNWQYCPHCVNYGGPWPTSKQGRLTWPDHAAPVCGEQELGSAGAPVESYVSGRVIDISVFITAQHGGRHTFRLCPSPDASEGCLDDHTLQRADGKGPYSWTPTTGGPSPGASSWRAGVLGGHGGEQYTWRYRLPQGVSCEHCVLQWWWTTANSCRVPGAPSFVGSDPGMLRCDEPGLYPEQFFNCADITIHASAHASGGSRRAAAGGRPHSTRGNKGSNQRKQQGRKQQGRKQQGRKQQGRKQQRHAQGRKGPGRRAGSQRGL